MIIQVVILSLSAILSLGGCYPQVMQAPQPAPLPPVASPVVMSPPAAKAQEAAVAIQKEAKDQELRTRELALGVYERLVDATRQGKLTQANFSRLQKSYDAVISALHAYSVLSPLSEAQAANARMGVAKALAEFLAQAQQLKIL